MFASIATVYYSNQAELIRECLLPIARKLNASAGVESAWLQKHWLRGPQVILHLCGEEAQAVAEQTAKDIRGYLELRPSTGSIDELDYTRLSRELGRMELIEPPYDPLLPDNSVLIERRRVQDTFVRSAQAAATKGKIMAKGLTVLEEAVLCTNVVPADAVYAGMAAIATSYPRWGLKSGYQAFLSHWKEYLHWADPERNIEHALAASFEQQREALVSRLEGAFTDAEAASAHDPTLRAWFDWVEAVLPLALRLAESGEVLPYPHPSRARQAEKFGQQTALQWSGSDERAYSDFHRAFRRLDFTRLGNGTDFAAYRFMINAFFDLLPLMEVSPLQRYSIAYMFSSASQIVVGESWQTTLERTRDRQSAEGEVVPTLPWRGDLNA